MYQQTELLGMFIMIAQLHVCKYSIFNQVKAVNLNKGVCDTGLYNQTLLEWGCKPGMVTQMNSK